jgi:hypothetical protein
MAMGANDCEVYGTRYTVMYSVYHRVYRKEVTLMCTDRHQRSNLLPLPVVTLVPVLGVGGGDRRRDSHCSSGGSRSMSTVQ